LVFTCAKGVNVKSETVPLKEIVTLEVFQQIFEKMMELEDRREEE